MGILFLPVGLFVCFKQIDIVFEVCVLHILYHKISSANNHRSIFHSFLLLSIAGSVTRYVYIHLLEATSESSEAKDPSVGRVELALLAMVSNALYLINHERSLDLLYYFVLRPP